MRAYVFQCFFIKIVIRTGPKTTKNPFKTVPSRFQEAIFSLLNFYVVFTPIWAPSWVDFASILAALWGPRRRQMRSKIGSKTIFKQNAPQDHLKMDFGQILGRSWAGLGRSGGGSGAVLGVFSGFFTHKSSKEQQRDDKEAKDDKK